MYSCSTEEYAVIILLVYRGRFSNWHLYHTTPVHIKLYDRGYYSMFNKSLRRLETPGNPAPAKAFRPQEINVRREEAEINAIIDNALSSNRQFTHNFYVSHSFKQHVLNHEILHPYHR